MKCIAGGRNVMHLIPLWVYVVRFGLPWVSCSSSMVLQRIGMPGQKLAGQNQERNELRSWNHIPSFLWLLPPGRDTDQASVCGTYDQSYPCRSPPLEFFSLEQRSWRPSTVPAADAKAHFCKQLAPPFPRRSHWCLAFSPCDWVYTWDRECSHGRGRVTKRFKKKMQDDGTNCREITFGFRPGFASQSGFHKKILPCVLQDVSTGLVVVSKMVWLGLRQFAVQIKYPCIGKEKPVGDFQASYVVKAQDQESGDQSSCFV